jgi:ABC-type Fe3+/spermidine/putrescine transport system ATPase subunit
VNPFVANFVGRADFIAGRLVRKSVVTALGVFPYDEQDSLAEGDEVWVLIRPDDVDFTEDPQGGAVIVDAQMLGPETIYKIKCPDGELIHSLKPSTCLIALHTKVTVTVKPAHVMVFPK